MPWTDIESQIDMLKVYLNINNHIIEMSTRSKTEIEANFTPELVRLMEMEEAATQDPTITQRNLHISDKIDLMMRKEISKAQNRQVTEQKKRVQSLFDRQEKERNILLQKLGERIRILRTTFDPTEEPDPAPPVLTPQQVFEEKIEALRKSAQFHLADDDMLNMKVAFQIQRDRIEFDWSQYSKQMYNSYKMRRAELTGESFTPEPTEFDQPAYWKEREKQEKLIHTAPILTPNIQVQSMNLVGPIEKQVQRLDMTYNDAIRQLNLQKQDALRWIKRQEDRMNIQIECSRSFLQLKEALQKKEDEHFKYIKNTLKNMYFGKDMTAAEMLGIKSSTPGKQKRV